MPEISVIVPVYNVENKLHRCLESLIDQTFTDFEVILIDDGSKDASGKICDEYAAKDKRFRVLHQQNKGVSAARNAGVEAAYGRYIGFVDSDDYVEREYLCILDNAIKKNGQLSICGVNFCSEYGSGKTSQIDNGDFSIKLSRDKEEVIAELIAERRFNYIFGKAYSRDILWNNDIRFLTDIALGEDTIFVMEYLKHITEIQVIGKAYYNYVNYSSGTLTHRFYYDIYDRYTFINNQILKSMKDMNIYGELIQEAVDQRQMQSFIWAISSIINSGLKRKKKLELIAKMENVPEFQEALKRHPELIRQRQEYRIAQQKSASKLLNYYKCEQIKTKLDKRFRIFVVSVFPKAVVRKVKSWL